MMFGQRSLKVFQIVLSAVLAIGILSACAGRGQSDSDEQRVLRVAVMYGDSYSKEQYRSQYLEIFQYLNPNIEIEIESAIDWNTYYRYHNPEEPFEEPNPIEEMRKLMEGANPPDVVILSNDVLPYFVSENLLMPLDAYIKQSGFDLDSFVPGVLESIRNAGNQSIYALAPQFSSTALIYNKQLFNEAGVPYPQDGMTWQDIFDLARRISAHYGGEKYGFAFNTYRFGSLFDGLITYSSPLQLQWVDGDGQQLMIDSESWRRVIGELVALYEQDVIPDNEDFMRGQDREFYTPMDYDAFLSGEVAMAPAHHSYLTEVINANERAHQIDGFDGIEWDVVTFPQHPEVPGVGGSMYMDPLMAINAKAGNPDDAWALISFINGEEWAELKSRSSGGSLMSRKDYIRPILGADYNIAAFYTMQPSPPWVDVRLVYENRRIVEALYIGEDKLNQVIMGQKSLDDALAEWQTEGTALLKRMKEESGDQAGPGPSGGGVVMFEDGSSVSVPAVPAP